jgi:hypothetical protein
MPINRCKIFQLPVSIAKMFDLIGGKLIAGDCTKLRAQNSEKNNYNPKKIERHLALAFNLKRLINISGKNEFKEYLEGLISSHFYIIYLYDLISIKIRHLKFDSDFIHSNIKVA